MDQAPSMYLRSKSYAEQQLLQSGHPLSVVRPSVVFGPGDRFLHVFAKLGGLSPIIPLAGAQARFAPVHVHDLCEAIGLLVLHRFDRLANRRPPGLLDLGTSRARSGSNRDKCPSKVLPIKPLAPMSKILPAAARAFAGLDALKAASASPVDASWVRGAACCMKASISSGQQRLACCFGRDFA
ncbi:MAG: hypothetical protein EBX69_09370 [Betaproteobacteria bacterium]|nr:hypothetical protein [Betaproteobacteria bacterium]